MSYLSPTKYGDCSQCPLTNTNVVKVGKLLYCLQCHRNNKTKIQITKANERNRVRSLSQLPGNKEMIKDKDVELELWFIHRRKEMVNVCRNCGDKTSKNDDKYWRYSVCHILPKALFPSVAKNVLNFVELCHFGNSCHANMDNNGYEYVREKMPKLWSYIVARFKLIYPKVSEKSKIPDVLLQELEPLP